MSFWQKVTERSWEHTGDVEEPGIGSAMARTPKRTALRMFLCVVTSVFFLLFVAYRIRMAYPDWQPMPLPKILWLNTAFLVLASIAMQWTRAQADGDRTGPLRLGMVASGLLTVAFIGGQLLGWSQLSAAGYILQGNPANAFFYLLTAVHGLHIVGGLWVWLKATRRAFGAEGAEAVRTSVQLCATYWHFLLLVWVVMLYFLMTT